MGDRVMRCVLLVSCIATFITAALLQFVLVLMRRRKGMDTATTILLAESAYKHEHNLGTKDIYLALTVCAYTCLVSAVAGGIALCTKARLWASINALVTLALGAAFLCIGFFVLLQTPELVRQVSKDVQLSCQKDVFQPLLDSFQCPEPIIGQMKTGHEQLVTGRRLANVGTAEKCGKDCKRMHEKFANIPSEGVQTDTQRCAVLHKMCEQTSVKQLTPAGLCRMINPSVYSSSYEAVLDSSAGGDSAFKKCRTFCERNIECPAFSFSHTSGYCSLVMSKEPKHTGWQQWKKVTHQDTPVGNTKDSFCYERQHHKVITSLRDFTVIIGAFSAVFGYILIFNFIASVILIIKVTKKTDGLFRRICCPCMKPVKQRIRDRHAGLHQQLHASGGTSLESASTVYSSSSEDSDDGLQAKLKRRDP